MATELAELYVKITGDTKDLDKSLATTDQKLGGVGKSVSKFGSLVKAAFTGAAVLGVAKLTKSLILAASNAEETQNKFSVVFGDVATEAEKSASAISNGYGLSETAAKTLLSSTGDILTGFGLNSEAALDLSVQTTQLAADLASFSNAQGGAEAVSAALTSAYTGERDSLKTYGIVISEAAVQAQILKDQQAGLVFETEQEAKSYATLTLALEQSKNAQGDFQRSQASFANQTRIAQARIEDLQVSLGSNLLPIANIGVTVFNDIAENALAAADNLGAFVRSADGAAQIGDVIGKLAGPVAVIGSLGKTAFGGLADGIKIAFEPLTQLRSESERTGKGFNILGGIIAGVAGAFKVLGTFASNNIQALIDLGTVLQSVGALGSAAIARLKGEISKEEFREEIGAVGDAFKNLGQGIVDGTRENFEAVKSFASSFKEASVAAADGAAGAYENAYLKASETVTTALVESGEQLHDVNEPAVESQNQVTEAVEETAAAVSELENKLVTTDDVWKDWADNANARLEELSTVGVAALIGSFSDLGEAFGAGELGWDSFAKAGLNAIAAVLDALAAQLTAQAAALIGAAFFSGGGSLVGLGPVLAGAAAASLSAGVFRGLAGSFEQGGIVPEIPGVSATGDNVLVAANPGERIVPADESSGNLTIMIELDGEVIANSTVENYVNKGRILVDATRGVR